MHRRTTLGEVTQSILNSENAKRSSLRTSMAGPSRPSVGLGPQRSSIGLARLSNVSSNSGRKSSIGKGRSGSYSVAGMKKDPRPIMDQKCIHDNTRILVEFLSAKGYNRTMSKVPSTSEFKSMMTFLFELYDPKWHSKSGLKFEDEAVSFLKTIGYPFNLSKSSLQAISAPQTWPKVLAAMMWLVEILNYDEAAQAYEANCLDKRACGNPEFLMDPKLDEKAFFEYVGNAYKTFLDGDDDGFSSLEQDFVKVFEFQKIKMQEELEEFQQIKQGIERSIREVSGKVGKLPELIQSRDAKCRDLEKFSIHVDQLLKHKSSLEEKVRERKMEDDKLVYEITQKKEASEQLRIAISKQELSAEDVRRMSFEQKSLRGGLQSIAQVKNDLQKECWGKEDEVNRRFENMEALLASYNSKALALQLIPLAAKNSNGQNFEIKLNRANLDNDEPILVTDFPGYIRPTLNAMGDTVVRRTMDSKNHKIKLEDAVEASDAELRECMELKKRKESEMKMLASCHEKSTAALDQELNAQSQKIEELEEQLRQLNEPDPTLSIIASNENRIVELRRLLEDRRQVCEEEKECIKNGILDVINVLSEHFQLTERIMAKKIEEISSYVNEIENGNKRG